MGKSSRTWKTKVPVQYVTRSFTFLGNNDIHQIQIDKQNRTRI